MPDNRPEDQLDPQVKAALVNVAAKLKDILEPKIPLPGDSIRDNPDLDAMMGVSRPKAATPTQTEKLSDLVSVLSKLQTTLADEQKPSESTLRTKTEGQEKVVGALDEQTKILSTIASNTQGINLGAMAGHPTGKSMFTVGAPELPDQKDFRSFVTAFGSQQTLLSSSVKSIADFTTLTHKVKEDEIAAKETSRKTEISYHQPAFPVPRLPSVLVQPTINVPPQSAISLPALTGGKPPAPPSPPTSMVGGKPQYPIAPYGGPGNAERYLKLSILQLNTLQLNASKLNVMEHPGVPQIGFASAAMSSMVPGAPVPGAGGPSPGPAKPPSMTIPQWAWANIKGFFTHPLRFKPIPTKRLGEEDKARVEGAFSDIKNLPHIGEAAASGDVLGGASQALGTAGSIVGLFGPIGRVAGTVLTFGSAMLGATKAVNVWNDRLLANNLAFSEFSGAMRGVSVEHNVRTMLIERERGERLAPSARNAALLGDIAERNVFAPVKDAASEFFGNMWGEFKIDMALGFAQMYDLFQRKVRGQESNVTGEMLEQIRNAKDNPNIPPWHKVSGITSTSKVLEEAFDEQWFKTYGVPRRLNNQKP